MTVRTNTATTGVAVAAPLGVLRPTAQMAHFVPGRSSLRGSMIGDDAPCAVLLFGDVAVCTLCAVQCGSKFHARGGTDSSFTSPKYHLSSSKPVGSCIKIHDIALVLPAPEVKSNATLSTADTAVCCLKCRSARSRPHSAAWHHTLTPHQIAADGRHQGFTDCLTHCRLDLASTPSLVAPVLPAMLRTAHAPPACAPNTSLSFFRDVQEGGMSASYTELR